MPDYIIHSDLFIHPIGFLMQNVRISILIVHKGIRASHDQQFEQAQEKDEATSEGKKTKKDRKKSKVRSSQTGRGGTTLHRTVCLFVFLLFLQGKKKGKEKGKSKGRRGDSDDEEDAAGERKLQNQFSFVERATQTMNNAMKVGKISASFIPRITIYCTINVAQERRRPDGAATQG